MSRTGHKMDISFSFFAGGERFFGVFVFVLCVYMGCAHALICVCVLMHPCVGGCKHWYVCVCAYACVCMCLCMHVWVQALVCVCICMHVCACAYACMCGWVQALVCVCVCVCVCICMHMHACVCMCLCMYVWVCVCVCVFEALPHIPSFTPMLVANVSINRKFPNTFIPTGNPYILQTFGHQIWLPLPEVSDHSLNNIQCCVPC